MANYQAKFRFRKTTKNTHVFDEVVVKGAPMIIGQLYVQKSILGEDPINEITVTVEFNDASA